MSRWNGQRGGTVKNIFGQPKDLGWYTRPNGKPSNFAELSRRPAAVIRFVHDYLSEGQKYGVASCSGGSVATFSAVYFHGVGQYLDYQQLAGGPYYDVSWACGAGPRDFALNPLAMRFIPVAKLVDYVHKTGKICQRHRSSPAFEASSPRVTAGDWHFEYPTDFLSTTSHIASDGFLGIRNQELAVFHRSTGPSVSLATDKGPHCMGNFLTGCRKICVQMLGRDDCPCEEAQTSGNSLRRKR